MHRAGLQIASVTGYWRGLVEWVVAHLNEKVYRKNEEGVRLLAHSPIAVVLAYVRSLTIPAFRALIKHWTTIVTETRKGP